MTLAEEINKWYVHEIGCTAQAPSRNALISKTIDLTLERAAQEAERIDDQQRYAMQQLANLSGMAQEGQRDVRREIAYRIRALK